MHLLEIEKKRFIETILSTSLTRHGSAVVGRSKPQNAIIFYRRSFRRGRRDFVFLPTYRLSGVFLLLFSYLRAIWDKKKKILDTTTLDRVSQSPNIK